MNDDLTILHRSGAEQIFFKYTEILASVSLVHRYRSNTYLICEVNSVTYPKRSLNILTAAYIVRILTLCSNSTSVSN